MPADLVRFDDLELDVQRYSLRRAGRTLKLERIPMELLLLLVGRAGQLVTREEIIQKLWGRDVFLDTDNSINTAIRKIRRALRDDSEQPRFVQTIPGKGYRFIAPIGEPSLPPPLELGSDKEPLPAVESHRRIPVPPRIRKRPVRIAIGVLALVAALAGGLAYRHDARIRWVREQALPQIRQLVLNRRPVAALLLFRRARQVSPNDPALKGLESLMFWPFQFHTSPAGADVLLRDYNEPQSDWQYLGKTPLENVRLPHDHYVVRFRKDGYETVETATGAVKTDADLFPVGTVPEGMVPVRAGQISLAGGASSRLADFFIDRYEVTNREYKKFVDAGGYHDHKYWKAAFSRSSGAPNFDQAMAQFRDKTDRPGPSTWELGSFLSGQDAYPVSGVSWYEAAAYAEFVGKSLPTVYHWYLAAFGRDARFSDILLLSNFSGKGPAPVGNYAGIGPFGTYDMAGNVKEWCFNATGGRRYILGGASTDFLYMFQEEDARLPLDRSPANGIRLVKYARPEALAEDLTAPIQNFSQTIDYRNAKPVSVATFRIYQSLYAYDPTPLEGRIESQDDSAPDWRRQRITFNAAYSNERVPAYLFLPKNVSPPYQTVVYFPHGAAQLLHSIEDGQFEGVDFLVRAGRAVMFPIYKDSYERLSQPPDPGTVAYRDETVEQAKDLRRALDYMDTRNDIDHARTAYYGVSWGGEVGAIMIAVEPRIKVAVLLSGGCDPARELSEADPINFAPQVKVPTLMMNGRYDFEVPLDTCQEPFFRLLGTPSPDKRHLLFDSGHRPPETLAMKEALNWLDRYLGPVK